MALSINWLTKVIFVPTADLTNLGGGKYRLYMDAFRLELKDLEDSEVGMNFPDTHRHATEATLSGTTYARQIEIINGYTVEFENGTYQVECVGANHNLGDVKVVNSVSLVIGNSAGLITVTSGSGLSATEQAQLRDVWRRLGLDPSNPMTTTDAEITAGDVEIVMTEPVAGTVVSTRQP